MPGRPPPKEQRLRALGVTALEPWEVSTSVRIRVPKEVWEVYAPLTAKEKGRVVEAGLKALGLLEERDEA
ncbi:MAG: hypothetical protein P3W93_001160 [Thermus sp.]|nr:hypothetical protein [Thermus sp.]